MWIFLNDAFLSIVEPGGDNPEDCLMVRARTHADLKRVFPSAEIIANTGTDYPFRAFIPRSEVAARIAVSVACINYGNFKDSVRDDHRHNVYLRVWTAMRELARRPRAKTKARIMRDLDSWDTFP